MGKSMQNVVSRSGRFSEGPARIVAEFTESISFDYQLAQADIAGSKAHARMIHSLGILSDEENAAIQQHLDEIALEISGGTFVWRPEHEDVHMNIESELTRRTPAGAKLHTGRSRNDQVAVSMRLWQREAMLALGRSLLKVQEALLALAQANSTVIIPGYTHLQRAQPITAGAYLLAYVLLAKAAVQAAGHLAHVPPAAGAAPRQTAAYRMVRLALPPLTAGLVLGAVWGKQAWGNWWNWDPKELWSLATWLTFVLYLHVRALTGGRRPRLEAALILAGAALVVITLSWANLSRLFAGLHSYAT